MSAALSLRVRFAVGMAALAIVVLAVMALAMYLGAERLLRSELDRHLHRDLEAAVHALRWDGQRYTWRDTIHPEDDQFDTEPAVELWTPPPRPQLLYRREPHGPAGAAIDRAPRLPPPTLGYRSVTLAGATWREAVERRTVEADARPVWMRTMRSEAPLRAELAALAIRIGAGALAGAVLCAWLAAASVGMLLSPIQALTRRMQRINTKPVEAMTGLRAERHAAPGAARQATEIKALEREFDAMLDRLARAHQDLERFAADCAHALRTPLTALRLRGEQQGRTLTDGAARDAIAGMLEEADRMSVLIQRLLLLAKAADADGTAQTVALDLNDMLGEALETLQPVAEQRGLALRQADRPANGSASEPAVRVQADPAWVRQVLQDLLYNAIQHAAPTGARVTGRIFRHGDMGGVELVDEGPGIPPQVLRRLGLPPWPAARAVTPPVDGTAALSTGTGLGLAIVARLLAAQGGRLELCPAEPRGTCARCWLPLVESTPEHSVQPRRTTRAGWSAGPEGAR